MLQHFVAFKGNNIKSYGWGCQYVDFDVMAYYDISIVIIQETMPLCNYVKLMLILNDSS